QIGSVEFAAARFGTRLVVVLGHSQCGAILAALEQLREPTGGQSRHLRSIVDRVRPAVEGVLAEAGGRDPPATVQRARAGNSPASVIQLRRGSRLIEQLIQREGLLVVGAEYSLDTGAVEFLESTGDAP